MMDKKKTLCVGRLLVDVPEQAETSLSGEMIQGFEIDTVEENDASFHERVTARESEIDARPTDAENPGGLIEARDLNVSGVIGRVLVYGKDHAYGFEDGHRVDSEWVSVEAHANLGGLSFTLSRKYARQADARLAEALFERLRLRDENEIPSEPGFCVWRAIFAEPLPKHKTEHITLHLGLPGHPDMGLFLNSIPGGDSGSTLLERIAEIDEESGIDELMRVTKLRSGKRSINGFDGEEEIDRVRELNLTTGYSFMWESRGFADDLSNPFLTLGMETGTNPRPGGRPVDSSLREDAALALWDGISSSIRLRDVGARRSSPEFKPAAHISQSCLQSDNTECTPNEVMLNIPRLDYKTAFNRQPVLSSDPNSIAKLVSTLP
jgi:hypothetical protein